MTHTKIRMVRKKVQVEEKHHGSTLLEMRGSMITVVRDIGDQGRRGCPATWKLRFWSRWRSVLLETLLRSSACFLFNASAFIDGYDVTSRLKGFYFRGEVFLGAQEPNFLFGTISCSCMPAGRFNLLMVSLGYSNHTTSLL